MNNDIKIGLVILNWNDAPHTITCLKSVEKTSYLNFEVFLVDNDSKDDSLAKIKEKFPNLNYITNKQNFGFAGGMNRGIESAISQNCGAVLVLNNDTILERDCVRLMAERLFSNDKVGAVVPMVYLGTDGNLIGSIGADIKWSLGEPRLIGYLEQDHGQYNANEVGYAPASVVLVKTEAIKKAGLLPEAYFMYAEDVEWSMNIIKAGFTIWTEPGAHIWHDESAASGKNSPFKFYYYIRNSLHFLKRNLTGKKYQTSIRGFYLKLLKLLIKYTIQGNFNLVAAGLKGFLAFKKNELGRSKNYAR